MRVASDLEAVCAWRRVLGRWVGGRATRVVRLSVGFAAGRHASFARAAAVARIRESMRRATRAERLFVSRDMRARLVALGFGAVASYGARIVGISPA